MSSWYSFAVPALRGLARLALQLSVHLTNAYCFASFVRAHKLAVSPLGTLILAVLDFCLNSMVLLCLQGGRPGLPLAAQDQLLFLLCYHIFSGPLGTRATEFWERSSLSVAISCVASVLGSQATLQVLETIYRASGPLHALPVAAAFCSKLASRYAVRWACAVRCRGSSDPQRRSTEPRKLLERATPSTTVNSQLAHALVAYAVYFPVRGLAGPKWAWRASFAVDCANVALALVAFFGFGNRNPEDVYTALVEGFRGLWERRKAGARPANMMNAGLEGMGALQHLPECPPERQPKAPLHPPYDN